MIKNDSEKLEGKSRQVERRDYGHSATASRSWIGAAVITLCGVLAYLNSFKTPLIFDGLQLIQENVSIRRLWPPWDALFGHSNVDRPLIGLTLAINYAISGLNVWSYHAVNLLIHILAGLALYGIVRRTLESARLKQAFGNRSTVLAMVVALIWVVHPLSTAAVTYLVQRCESQMGLFYLVTLYCAIRAFTSARRALWSGFAIAACAAGMLSKQVIVTAPVMVLLYDVMFESGSLREAWRSRKELYLGLAGTWMLLAATIAASPANPTAGFGIRGIGSLDYFKSEFGVIAHYLRLSIWPEGQVLDYHWPPATSAAEILPGLLLVGLLFGLTLWALIKRKPIAYCGAWFFVVLSLTSSLMPFTDLAFEHRMYLPLAGVVGVVVLGGYYWGNKGLRRVAGTDEAAKRYERTIGVALVTMVVMLLGYGTLQRNIDYTSGVTIWRDTVNKVPNNPRAHGSLGLHLFQQGNLDEAREEFSTAIGLRPNYPEAESYLGFVLFLQGDPKAAAPHIARAIELRPDDSGAHYHMGRALLGLSNADGAIQELSRSVEIEPTFAEAHFYLADALRKGGRTSEADDHLNTARRLWPELVDYLTSQN